MGAHRFFCPRESLDEILLFSDDYETIFNIVDQFCDVVLNIEEDDILKEVEKNPMLKALFKRESANLIGNKNNYEQLENKEYQKFLNDILVLDEVNEVVEKIREDYGILAISKDDEFLEKQNFHFGFTLNGNVDCKFKSWKDIFSQSSIIPVNSAILVDNFLWGNLDDFENENKENIYIIFEHLIPKNLKVPFHLNFVIQNGKQKFNTKNTKDKINKLQKNLSKICGVEVIVGITTQTDTKIFHERVLITNYHYVYSDKGFVTFKNNRIFNRTKGDRNWVFKDINDYIGELRKHHQIDVIKNVRNAINTGDEISTEVIFNIGHMNNPLLN